MNRPLKLIRSLIKEMEGLKFDGSNRPELPHLTMQYETWYTKALRVVQNGIPERLEDFVSTYKSNRTGLPRPSSYTIQDYLMGIKVMPSTDCNSDLLFQRLILRQAAILSSALKERPISEETSEGMLQREFYKQALVQAKKLFKTGKIVPAGVVAGTVLDNYLQWLCKRRNLELIQKQQSLTAMNDVLYRFKSYTHPTFIRIQRAIPVAEACLSPRKEPPSKKEIGILIADVRKIVYARH